MREKDREKYFDFLCYATPHAVQSDGKNENDKDRKQERNNNEKREKKKEGQRK
jgi:hypothetical protein